jgi:hypothetical protein
MRRLDRIWRFRAALLLLAALATLQSGCIAAVAGCAAGGAAGYAYYKGKYQREYVASRDDVWAALHTSMNELQMPIVKEERKDDEDCIETTSADGDKVRIYLDAKRSPIQVEGQISTIGIRVNTWGDESISRRILDQVDMHLMPGLGAQPQQPVQQTGARLNGPQPAPGAPPPPTPYGPRQTAPPPLAEGQK